MLLVHMSRSCPILEDMENTPRTAPDRPDKSAQRSRIANGSALLPAKVGRTAWVRRLKDCIGEHIADLGGVDNTSAAERSLIRRASTLTVELERLECKFAAADAASDNDLDLYQRTAGNLRRLLKSVGIQRRAKQVTDLNDYVEHVNGDGDGDRDRTA